MTGKADAVRAVTQQFKDRTNTVIGGVMAHLRDDNAKEILGPGLSPLIGRGSLKSIVTFALYTAILRLVRESLGLRTQSMPHIFFHILQVLIFVLLVESTALAQIPSLDKPARIDKSEGDTDTALYLSAVGTAKAVMLFVDFPDAPAHQSETQPIASHLMGNGDVQRFFKEQSSGKMSLDVTIVNGWKRMPKPIAQYVNNKGLFSWDEHKAYISDACALFEQLNFAPYQIVYVVAAKTPTIRLSPAFHAWPGTGVKTPTGEIRHAATFGFDSYSNRCTTLIHETGHILGLPDLYGLNGQPSTVGTWELMCDIFTGTSFCGWHRHKLGWLDDNRKAYLATGTLRTLLTPLSTAKGVSMIVVPEGNPEHPAKVFCIELAQPVLGPRNELGGQGVLIYSVDARIKTGDLPVVLYSRMPPQDNKCYHAPFQAGDTFDDPSLPMTVKILNASPKGYQVLVTKKKGK